jgi:hypothetical protein
MLMTPRADRGTAGHARLEGPMAVALDRLPLPRAVLFDLDGTLVG